MVGYILLAISFFLVLVVLGDRWLESRRHKRRLSAIGVRIHVNGIRGKSTVTRIVAGMLREAGYKTIAKATGSAAEVIMADGTSRALRRYSAPTILEQIDLVKDWVPDDCDALVVECMALRPSYQAISEAHAVRSTIGVLTNVREDHQDVMGETRPEIARSLLNTCPRNGTLVTGEQDPAIQKIMEEEARRRGSTLAIARPDWVTDVEIERFDYISFKENVAIGLQIASLLGIPRDVAMDGMVKAAPDPGVLRVKHVAIGDKRVTWANLFAVNDRESTVAGMERLGRYCTPQTTTVGILNNRRDREQRANQFADVAVFDLQFDRLVTFGAYEKSITARLVANGYPTGQVINLGEQHDPSLDEIINQLIYAMPTPHVLLVGLVNIHTEQAEKLLEFLEGISASERAIPKPEPAVVGVAAAKPYVAAVSSSGEYIAHDDAEESLIKVDDSEKEVVGVRPSERKLVPVAGGD